MKSLLIEMGFTPTLVQKAIDENGTETNILYSYMKGFFCLIILLTLPFQHPGEDDLELLLETLTKSSVPEHSEPSFHGLVEPKPVHCLTCYSMSCISFRLIISFSFL